MNFFDTILYQLSNFNLLKYFFFEPKFLAKFFFIKLMLFHSYVIIEAYS